jgi:hypothetical protein
LELYSSIANRMGITDKAKIIAGLIQVVSQRKSIILDCIIAIPTKTITAPDIIVLIKYCKTLMDFNLGINLPPLDHS